jgi:hypothetical protein
LSDSSELLIGVTLLVVSIAIFVLCLPRRGKTAWFVRVPFLAPMVAVLLIGGFAVGLIEIAAYYTTIDDLTLSGKP